MNGNGRRAGEVVLASLLSAAASFAIAWYSIGVNQSGEMWRRLGTAENNIAVLETEHIDDRDALTDLHNQNAELLKQLSDENALLSATNAKLDDVQSELNKGRR